MICDELIDVMYVEEDVCTIEMRWLEELRETIDNPRYTLMRLKEQFKKISCTLFAKEFPWIHANLITQITYKWE